MLPQAKLETLGLQVNELMEMYMNLEQTNMKLRSWNRDLQSAMYSNKEGLKTAGVPGRSLQAGF